MVGLRSDSRGDKFYNQYAAIGGVAPGKADTVEQVASYSKYKVPFRGSRAR